MYLIEIFNSKKEKLGETIIMARNKRRAEKILYKYTDEICNPIVGDEEMLSILCHDMMKMYRDSDYWIGRFGDPEVTRIHYQSKYEITDSETKKSVWFIRFDGRMILDEFHTTMDIEERLNIPLVCMLMYIRQRGLAKIKYRDIIKFFKSTTGRRNPCLLKR